MGKLADRLGIIAVTLWVGGLWAVGYLAVPVLFFRLDDKMLAGALAGQMFTLIAYVGLATGGYLIGHRLAVVGRAAWRQPFFWVVGAMLALTVAIHFGIQPILQALKAQVQPLDVMHSALRDRFAAWHGVSSILYLIQSLLGLLVAVNTGSRLR